MLSQLNKARLFIGTLVLFTLSTYLISQDVLATGSCSLTASDWTDPSLCGHGSMTAIIITTHDANLEKRLAAYDSQHGLPICTVDNGCLEIATPFGTSNTSPPSRYDMAPVVEQVHQSTPGTKILVVEAKSTSWYDKYDAVNYVKALPDVSRISSVSYSKVVVVLGLVLK